MNNLIESLKSKKFRYGAFSTLLAVFVIAILLVVNLVVEQLNIRFDLTPTRMYSISQASIDFIRDLEEDVTIYALFRTGQEPMQFQLLLEQYSIHSNRVRVVYRDPFLHPQFVDQFRRGEEEDIPVNSVIVTTGRRHRVIPAGDMATFRFNMDTWRNELVSIDIEPQVTNAIVYVTEDYTPVIYMLTGQNEFQMSQAMIDRFMLNNYEFREINLFYEERVPEDAAMLFVTTPERDWPPIVADRVREYLANDGNAFFLIDYTVIELPNLRAVLNSYGVDIPRMVVHEASLRNMLQANPLFVLPDWIAHDVTRPLIQAGYRNLIVMPMPVETLEIRKSSLTIEPLFVSSNVSYAKTEAGATINREPGDIDGPFDLAVAITDSFFTSRQHTSRLVVMGTTSLLDPTIDNLIHGANADFVLNSINWLVGGRATMFIRSMSPDTGLRSLMIDDFQGLVISIVSMALIPIAILATGIVVWMRRRNR